MDYLGNGAVVLVERFPARDHLYKKDGRQLIHKLKLDRCLLKMLFDNLCATGQVSEDVTRDAQVVMEVMANAGEPDTFRYQLRWASNDTVQCGRLYGYVEPKRPPNGYSFHGAMVSRTRLLKDTLFEFGYGGMSYADFDQAKGHPSIFRWLSDMIGQPCEQLAYYLENFSAVAQVICEYLRPQGKPQEFTESDVKLLYTLTMYGGSWGTFIAKLSEPDPKHPLAPVREINPLAKLQREQTRYAPFVTEVRRIAQLLYAFNPAFAQMVCNGKTWKMTPLATDVQKVSEKDPAARRLHEDEPGETIEHFIHRKKVGRFSSFVLQQIEGTFTDLAAEFLTAEGYTDPGTWDLGHDGLTILPKKPLEENVVARMNAFVRERSGCPYVTFVHKPFKLDPRVLPILERRRAMTPEMLSEYLKPRIVGMLPTVEDAVAAVDPFDLVRFFRDVQTVVAGEGEDTYQQAYGEMKAVFERSVQKVLGGVGYLRARRKADVWLKGKECEAKVMKDGLDWEFKAMTEAELKSDFKNVKFKYMTWVREVDEGGQETLRPEPKEANFLPVWMDDRMMRTLDGIELKAWSLIAVGNRAPVDLYYEQLMQSIWTPFRFDLACAQPSWDVRDHRDNLHVFFEHCHLLCGFESNVTAGLIQWLAHMVQYPETKCKFAPILYGSHGCGKSMWVNILRMMFGRAKVVELSTDKYSFGGDFNDVVLDKILTVYNEFEKDARKGTVGQHKTGVTECDVYINSKHMKGREVTTYERQLYISNKGSPPFKIEAGERRFMLMHASGCKARDSEYLARVDNLAANEGFLKTLYWWLSQVDLREFLVQQRPPISSYQREIMLNQTPEYLRFLEWLYGFLRRCKVENKKVVPPVFEEEEPSHGRHFGSAYRKEEVKAGLIRLGDTAGRFILYQCNIADAWKEFLVEARMDAETVAKIGSLGFIKDKLLSFADCFKTNPVRDRSSKPSYIVFMSEFETMLREKAVDPVETVNPRCYTLPLPMHVADDDMMWAPTYEVEQVESLLGKRKHEDGESTDSPNAC